MNKKCSVCGEVKLLTEFYNHRISKDGHSWHCKQCNRILRKEYYLKNRRRIITHNCNYRKNNRKISNLWHVKNYQKKRKIVLNHYGSKCACCGETEEKFLSVDHMNNDGANHRRSGGKNITIWLIKNNFPEGFQLLCYNCNIAKGMYGQCPHKKEGANNVIKQ
jgi:hypothetical protein